MLGILAKRPPPEIDGLVQEKRNSSANALELRISCTNLSNYLCLKVTFTM